MGPFQRQKAGAETNHPRLPTWKQNLRDMRTLDLSPDDAAQLLAELERTQEYLRDLADDPFAVRPDELTASTGSHTYKDAYERLQYGISHAKTLEPDEVEDIFADVTNVLAEEKKKEGSASKGKDARQNKEAQLRALKEVIKLLAKFLVAVAMGDGFSLAKLLSSLAQKAAGYGIDTLLKEELPDADSVCAEAEDDVYSMSGATAYLRTRESLVRHGEEFSLGDFSQVAARVAHALSAWRPSGFVRRKLGLTNNERELANLARALASLILAIKKGSMSLSPESEIKDRIAGYFSGTLPEEFDEAFYIALSEERGY